MGDELAREWERFMKMLDLPTVGQPRRDAELAELRRLIGRYTDEARAILRECGDP